MNDREQRDKELDEMLAPFRKLDPKASYLNSWQQTVESARTKRRFRWLHLEITAVPQLAAAIFIGFLLGMVFVKNKPAPADQFAEKNFEPSATIEEIYAKSD